MGRHNDACGINLGALRQQLPDALPHFPGGFIRESDGQNVPVRNSMLQQKIEDTTGNDPRLAAAWPGHDQQGAFEMGHGLLLSRRQIGE